MVIVLLKNNPLQDDDNSNDYSNRSVLVHFLESSKHFKQEKLKVNKENISI